VLSSFFGSNYAFSTTSSSLAGVTRSFASFWDAANEAGMSRIYGGIHFSFSNTDGLATGTQVGDWTLAAFDATNDTVPPKILLDQTSGLATSQDPTITGEIVTNFGVTSLTVALDGGTPSDVAVNGDGTFALPLTLRTDGSADGMHTLTLVATDGGGLQGTQSFSFDLATQPPRITLAASGVQDGGTLAAGARLTGTVTLPAGDSITALSYTFDGGVTVPVAFDPTTGAFDQALDLSKLAVGATHVLTISATDAAGRTTTQTLDNLSLPFLPLR
jgi:hypothetical protein